MTTIEVLQKILDEKKHDETNCSGLIEETTRAGGLDAEWECEYYREGVEWAQECQRALLEAICAVEECETKRGSVPVDDTTR